MSPPRAHVVGAGLAGLGAAVALAGGGAAVELSDSAAQAGGRCRSYHDRELDLVIDNGNHLVLSGNRAVHAYLHAVGASERIVGPQVAAFPYVDLATGERWTLRPNAGPLGWWVLSAARRVPGTRARDYLPLLGLVAPGRAKRVRDVLPTHGPVWERLLENFLVAVLNTEPAEGSAALAAAVVRETLLKGGRHYRPRVAEPTLAHAFVDPALAWLEGLGATVRLSRRLKSLEFDGDRVARLHYADGPVEVAPGEAVVLALPPWAATALVPGLTAPDDFRAIVNAHYRFAPPSGAAPILGVIGGTAEWVFAFPDRVSVTVSAADRLVDEDRAVLAARIWADVARALDIPADTPLPPWQVVKEKRATFAATPEQDARRPGAATAWRNLWLAGDWTATGLPATIEGALRSGERAAKLALAARSV